MCIRDSVAEYSGLVAGLKAAFDIDPAAEVTVRLDSKLLVEQMSGRWKIKQQDMRRLALRARDIAADLSAAGGSVTYTWLPRAENSAADALANSAMDGTPVSWTSTSELAVRSPSPLAVEEPSTPAVQEPSTEEVGHGPDLLGRRFLHRRRRRFLHGKRGR